MKIRNHLVHYAISTFLVLVAASAQADYESDILGLSPIAYWRLNETSGTTASNLGSLGASANGTYVDAVTLGAGGPPGDFGPTNTAISVGPADGSVQTGSPFLSNMAAFTIMAYINTGTLSGTRIGLVGQNNAIEFGFIAPDTLQIWTASTAELDVAWTLPSGSWHHVAATGDGTDLRIYIDGVLAGTFNSPTANYGSSGDGVNIGGGGIFDGSGNQFTGSIDEVAIFSEALAASEIAQLANRPSTQQAIPTMSQWYLLLLAVLVTLAGLAGVRRMV